MQIPRRDPCVEIEHQFLLLRMEQLDHDMHRSIRAVYPVNDKLCADLPIVSVHSTLH
jgi:hypothetical protein